MPNRAVPARLSPIALAAGLFLAGARGSCAQQPFVTDDAEVTPRAEWHFEFANSFAKLQKSDYPNLRQNTSNFVIQYGLARGLEVNMDFPLISITNAGSSGVPNAFGLGDLDFAVKWNLVGEPSDRSHPAVAVDFAVEFPTGDKKKQLGSGLTDYVFNLILQKTFSQTLVHLNGGIQFSGNTTTGAEGIRTPGRIYSVGLSGARDVSERLRLGLDLNGAEVHKGPTADKQLQLTAGGNWGLFRSGTLDFAVFAGWFSAPRVGIMLGVSLTP